VGGRAVSESYTCRADEFRHVRLLFSPAKGLLFSIEIVTKICTRDNHIKRRIISHDLQFSSLN
jgi:hypothetical protein